MASVQQRTAGQISYRLTRGGVKNINLRIRPDGTVAVSAPARVPLAEVDALVRAKAGWILQAQAKVELRAALAAAQPLPDKGDALADLVRRTEYWAARIVPGRTVPTVSVRDMRSRWGVCYIQKNHINYALRLALQSPAAREYVVIHELCHLLVPNHSAAFWAQVSRFCPDWKARRASLR